MDNLYNSKSEEKDEPLLDLETILGNVLKCLPSKEVAKCRLVSRLWESLATQIMLKRRDLTVNLDCNSAQEFFDLMKKSERNPFACLMTKCLPFTDEVVANLWEAFGDSLKVVVFDMSINEERIECWKSEMLNLTPQPFLEFLRKFGQTLQVLDFDKMSIFLSIPPIFNLPEQNAPLHFYDSFKVHCSRWSAPGLKKIVFPAASHQDRFSVIFWALVFTQTVNLSEVYLNAKTQTEPLLMALEEANRLDQLKKLGLEYISEIDVERILDSKVQLEEFRINTISNDVSRQQMEELLEKFVPTLKVLVLGSLQNDEKMSITIPKMPELTELCLFHSGDSLILLEDFGANIPKLRKLTVESQCKSLDWKEYFSLGGYWEPMNTEVKTLDLSLEVADSEFCSYLGQRFPNVQNLSLKLLKNEFLGRMWITWQNLTVLYIKFDEYSITTLSRDISLCGFSEHWMNSKKEFLNTCSKLSAHQFNTIATMNASHLSRLGFVGVHNLKCLQKLIIDDDPIPKKRFGHLFVSDLSVYWSLATLKDLRVLKIGCSRITNRAKKYLCKKLPMIIAMEIRGEDQVGIFSEKDKAEPKSFIDYYNSFEDD